jgi:hypothetical protein
MSAQNNLCQVLGLQKGYFVALAYDPQFMCSKIQDVTHECESLHMKIQVGEQTH